MNQNGIRALLAILILAGTVFFAGCSGSSGTGGNTTTAAAGTVAQTTAGPLYSAGDVVRNPNSTSTTALIIIGYDPATDMYERALLYPGTGGSWYRMNADTVNAPRSVIEKVYTEKVATLSVPAVPIGTPTPLPTSTTPSVSSATTVATTSVATAPPPAVYDIHPDTGIEGTTVSVTDLHGNNFVTGATVRLSRDGSADIVATNVQVGSPTDLTCTFAIPVGVTYGSWDVVVTNPDGQSASYTNIFEIHYNPNAVTTTASGTTSGGITIASIDPSTIPVASNQRVAFTISGSNFNQSITATLKSTSGKNDIPMATGTDCQRSSTSLMTCYFDIPVGSQGLWNLYLKNTADNSYGTLTNAVTING
ncbi:MAG TPA: hypothetical protein VLY83_03875 [Methanoregula sp.]|nr:hypothetical protein [Methanoregula sp.]